MVLSAFLEIVKLKVTASSSSANPAPDLASMLRHHHYLIRLRRYPCYPIRLTRYPCYLIRMMFKLELFFFSAHLNTRAVAPTKRDARLSANHLLGSSEEQVPLFFQMGWKQCFCAHIKPFFSDALALWNQIKFKVAHQVCARGVFPALRRASSSALNTGCFIKALCILIGCALCLWRQGHWQLENTQRW